MWYEPVLEIGMDLLIKVFLAFLTIATGYAISYIKSTRDSITTDSDSRLIEVATDRLAEVALLAVNRAEEVTAKYLREQVKEGDMSRDALLEVGRNVKREILQVLGEDAVDVLSDAYGDLDLLVDEYIEMALEAVKRGKQ